jgi:hypothetical protein
MKRLTRPNFTKRSAMGDSFFEKFFDLGEMSYAKEKAIREATTQHDCDHPVSSHTGTEDTWPYLVCAHRPCPCVIVRDE